MFQSIIDSTSGGLSLGSALICTAASLILGIAIAAACRFRNPCSRTFTAALILLPAIVQAVIMMVNGQIGTGVAVMGAFSLIRFRSVPGNARDICFVFLAMAVGIATGMGYVTFALCLTAILAAVIVLLNMFSAGGALEKERELRVTIPENLDYVTVFDDLFEKYTSSHSQTRVKTTNMGSLFELRYRVVLKDPAEEKAFIDELRCRNGNLPIALGRPESSHEEFSL